MSIAGRGLALGSRSDSFQLLEPLVEECAKRGHITPVRRLMTGCPGRRRGYPHAESPLLTPCADDKQKLGAREPSHIHSMRPRSSLIRQVTSTPAR